MMSQPLAQTLDIGVPEPVADAGYHFVGWNLEIEYMRGPPECRRRSRRATPKSGFFSCRRWIRAAYVPVRPLDNYYISKLTFTAMFAHDPASDPCGDDPAPNPGGGGGGGGRRRRGRFRPEAARASPQAARSEAVGRPGAA